jgi:hypothetical protein
VIRPTLGQDEFKVYLQRVGIWGTEAAYSDELWGAGFPAICEVG